MFTRPTRHLPRTTALAAAAATITLTLAGCVGQPAGSGGAGSAGEGVPVGATKEEYIAAFENVDPIHIMIPEAAQAGSVGAKKTEMYAEALEEWSGGKITTEIGYSNSFAAAPEVEGALSDDRVQVGTFYPSMNPAGFPVLTDVMNVSNQTHVSPVVGLMQALGAMNETIWSSEEILGEIDEAGIAPLLPGMSQSVTQGFMCTEPLNSADNAAGRLVRAPSSPVSGQIEAIGATPVSITTAEMYEGLQRGTVECNTASIYGSYVLNAVDVAPHFSTSEKIATIATVGSLGFSKLTWDELPLVAKQLLWDRSDAFLVGYIEGMIESDVEGIEAINAAGGSITEWDDSIVSALEESRDEAIAGVANPELAELYGENAEKWYSIVTDELGYDDGGSLAELADWYDPAEADYQPFADYLLTDVLAEHRPS
ncbi:hypothetical protein [Microbacterium sp. NPDC096154]|uniref:hypothetical protein n=1 Tax=Microbacterium sp. NPDC096154 TaxID=3155549 RepID=UPI00331A2921